MRFEKRVALEIDAPAGAGNARRWATLLLTAAATMAGGPARASAETPARTATAAISLAGSSTHAPVHADPVAEALSWNMLFGGVPEAGSLLQAEIGFSMLPRVAFHQSLGSGLSLGGLVGVDYANFRPVAGFHGSVVFGGVVRYAIALSGVQLGLRGEAGFRIPSSPNDLALFANLEGNFGFPLGPRAVLGGGLAMPIELAVGSGTAIFSWPLLIGPAFEYHVTPPFALTFDAKFGPHLASVGGTGFGMKVLGGVAFRL